MKEIEFENHFVAERKDLLHFVEKNLDKNIYKHIVESPEAWIEELNIINNMLTREGIVCAEIHSPPIGDPDFKNLGNDVFLYRGREAKLRGLWIKKEVSKQLAEMTGQTLEELAKSCFGWSQYSMGLGAHIKINKDFLDIPVDSLLPENFEKSGKARKKGKRPVIKFKVYHNGREINVFAKGSCLFYRFYYPEAKPKFRLTSLSNIIKQSSETEMEKTLKMAKAGINTPNIIGYYSALVEEFLFLEEVVGNNPRKFLDKNKYEIIQADAEMLAKLCLAGYRKQGFSDFDDKIFDGNKLSLIDVDECVDIYNLLRLNYREILLNPRDNKELRSFRRLQRDVFRGTLKDALFDYRNSLTPTKDDMIEYINRFYGIMGWKISDREISRLTTFEEHYTTHDTWISEMSSRD